MPTPKTSQVYIHIIESPSAGDLLNGRTEGRTLGSFLELAGIGCTYCLATDLATFQESLSARIVDGLRRHAKLPMLHVSSHGDKNGIALTNGHFVAWRDLSGMLRPINAALSNNLILCLSTCYGLRGSSMAIDPDLPLPMHALIACGKEVPWHTAALGFLTFYYQLLVLERDVNEAVSAMCAATANADFRAVRGEELQAAVRQFLSSPPKLQQEVLRALSELERARQGTEKTGQV